MIIRVDRDRASPSFRQTEINVTITDKHIVDQFVTSVSATDGDEREVVKMLSLMF